jgi:hypothetical protein
MLPIRALGCIYFDELSSRNPISTIRALLEKANDVSNALIVLPEALDLGDGYYSSQRDYKPAASLFTRGQLKSLARGFGVAFVAGLMEKAGCHAYNSAFLVDPERTCRLSRKMSGDDYAGWYEPNSHCDSRCVTYRGVTLACLICKDAQDYLDGPRSQPHQRRIVECLRTGLRHRILCVPGRMSLGTPSLEANEWPNDINVVVANIDQSAGARCGGIRLAKAGWRPCSEGICLEPLPDP